MRDRKQVERATQAVEAHLRVTAFRTRKQVEADIEEAEGDVMLDAFHGVTAGAAVHRLKALYAELALIEQKESGNA